MKNLICLLVIFAASLSMADATEGRLINGEPADPKDWPSSVYASMSGSRCSATVIGANTLLIASHCVKNGGKAVFSVGPNQYTSVCNRTPQYSNNSTSDWALCLTDKQVAGTVYESINTDPDRVRVGDELTLTGYGCIKPGGGGGNDGVFRVGTSKVTRMPQGNSNDIITKSGAALCYGDSGGAAYFVDKTTKARWIVGVNSRGDIKTTSYLPSLSSETSIKFLTDWAQKNNQKICGLHADAEGCRSLQD